MKTILLDNVAWIGKSLNPFSFRLYLIDGFSLYPPVSEPSGPVKTNHKNEYKSEATYQLTHSETVGNLCGAHEQTNA